MVDQKRRKNLRLPGYDYRQPGAYFITTAIHARQNLLGAISDEDLLISDAGKIVLNVWNDLPKHYPRVVLDVFCIMPNHVHGILFLEEESRIFEHIPPSGRGGSDQSSAYPITQPDPPLPGTGRHFPSQHIPLPGMERHGLPEIIRAFKSFSARRINLMRGTPGLPVWQRNYYEHIIRNEKSLDQIREYILGNVILWNQDQFYQHD